MSANNWNTLDGITYSLETSDCTARIKVITGEFPYNIVKGGVVVASGVDTTAYEYMALDRTFGTIITQGEASTLVEAQGEVGAIIRRFEEAGA